MKSPDGVFNCVTCSFEHPSRSFRLLGKNVHCLPPPPPTPPPPIYAILIAVKVHATIQLYLPTVLLSLAGYTCIYCGCLRYPLPCASVLNVHCNLDSFFIADTAFVVCSKLHHTTPHRQLCSNIQTHTHIKR